MRAALRITLLKEAQAQIQYAGQEQDLYYAESPSGETLDLILDGKGSKRAYQLSIEAVPYAYATRYAGPWATAEKGVVTILSSTAERCAPRRGHSPWRRWFESLWQIDKDHSQFAKNTNSKFGLPTGKGSPFLTTQVLPAGIDCST